MDLIRISTFQFLGNKGDLNIYFFTEKLYFSNCGMLIFSENYFEIFLVIFSHATNIRNVCSQEFFNIISIFIRMLISYLSNKIITFIFYNRIYFINTKILILVEAYEEFTNRKGLYIANTIFRQHYPHIQLLQNIETIKK